MQNVKTRFVAAALLSMLLVCSAQAQDMLKHHDKLASQNLDTATDIIGTKVDNQQGNSLGSITDLMIDPQSGHVAYAILSRGGVLGVGAKLYPVPFRAAEYNKQSDRFILNLSEDRLNSAPNFASDSWPDLSSTGWRQRTDSFYQTQEGAVENMRGRAAEITDHSLVRISKIKDKGVFNLDGQRIATISNFVIDTSRGQVQYVVLSRGGVMGVGDKLHAVPWDAAKYNPSKQSLTIDASKDKIDNSPSFTSDKWPDMSDSTWKAQVDRYYGVKSGSSPME